MTCPDCGATWLRPARHVEDDPPRREYVCRCGARFTTVEQVATVCQREQLLMDLFRDRAEFRRDVAAIVRGGGNGGGKE